MEYTETQLLTEEEGQAAQYLRAVCPTDHDEDVDDAVQVLVKTICELRCELRRERSRRAVTLIPTNPRDMPLMADEDGD